MRRQRCGHGDISSTRVPEIPLGPAQARKAPSPGAVACGAHSDGCVLMPGRPERLHMELRRWPSAGPSRSGGFDVQRLLIIVRLKRSTAVKGKSEVPPGRTPGELIISSVESARLFLISLAGRPIFSPCQLDQGSDIGARRVFPSRPCPLDAFGPPFVAAEFHLHTCQQILHTAPKVEA